MIRPSPFQLILIGFVLLVIGFILPFLMVLQLLESTLLLNFVAYLASLFGLIIGLVGVVLHIRPQRSSRD
jgi:membrane associated rhomboid family serine protease